MRRGDLTRPRLFLLVGVVLFLFFDGAAAQSNTSERTFTQAKETVERALKGMRTSMAGRLPVLDGFVAQDDHPLDHYQRAYYQSTVQVSAAAAGGSLVRVSTKITAWYADAVTSRSGYRLLNSNGRLETDLLDQLSEQLTAGTAPAPAGNSASSPQPPARTPTEPALSAPVPRFPQTPGTFSSSVSQSLSAQEHPPKGPEEADKELRAEARSLEEILKNQAHPTNLVAVKKSGTPVVVTPSLNAKTLFLASAHDEFEMLDFNPDWVHVRISGISRGWIWRNSVEMPEGIPDVEPHPGTARVRAAADFFHVTREETAIFPGDWAPLRGKSVKIISVEKVDEPAKDEDPNLKLEFAKSVFDKASAELAQKSTELSGVVLIFDSADGGMIAATATVLQQWKAGTLTDSALWHQSFFDPPEVLDAVVPSASQ